MLLTRRNLRATMMTEETILLSRLFKRLPANGVIKLADGTVLHKLANPAYTIVFKNMQALRRAANHPDAYHLAMAYVRGDLEIEGDLFAAVTIKNNLKRTEPRLFEKFAIAIESLSPLRHAKKRDAQYIASHYDVSNEFYQLFLDKGLNYSCAYFETPDDDIDKAEENKLRYIARKLRLQKGDSLLDIGCGWGGMIIYAAKHFGVKAHGITLSRKQYEFAQDRIRSEGLSEYATVEFKDYRDLRGERIYDKIVSIGMYEHVGLRNLPTYFHIVYRLLKDRGLFLNHGIVRNVSLKNRIEGKFIARMIFPGGELDTIGHTIQVAEQSGFEVLDVESLREHYARTLRLWTRRLQERQHDARKLVSEEVIRARLIFMAGYAEFFEEGGVSVYQTLLCKRSLPGFTGAPLTREYMYQS